ncbi:MAG: helix-turn-helix transcriptional regulator [Gemmatimonadaceae bacterium]|nr:helix-turn-helix transcriptional regulator [Gemmatimonadaceae bacterium]MBA3655962.1 helix-turn-helix transcriptional regulator [Gemmatimonadaceae bacterium]
MKSPQFAFGRAVRRLRVKQGLSQERFAQLAKVDRTYMSEIERGVTNISLAMAERIARALGILVSELLAESEQEK